MRQLLTPLPQRALAPWPVPDALRHRLERVLRLPEGSVLTVADGDGRQVQVRLQSGQFVPLGPCVAAPAAVPEIELACGLIKGERWDWLVEKAVELGATRLQPLATDHCVVQLDPRRSDDKLARWQALADGAFEQCGRPFRCTVAPPLALTHWLAQAARQQMTVLWCDERAADPLLGDWLAAHPWSRIAVACGPEGGWSEAERAHFDLHRAQAVGLGPAVLRAETAAIAALVIAGTVKSRCEPRLDSIHM